MSFYKDYAKWICYLNGSLNILRKVIGEFQYPIEACSMPRVEIIFDTRKLIFHQIT